MAGLGLIFLRRSGQSHPTAGSDYIKFADEAVFNVLMSKGISSDGIGITKDDAAAVTSIGTYFYRNTNITSFNELQYFINLKDLEAQYTFYQCSNLAEIFLEYIETMNNRTFYQCTALQEVVMPNLREVEGTAHFLGAGVVELIAPKLSVVPDSFVMQCKSLQNVLLGGSSLGYAAFYQCSALQHLVFLSETPSVLGNLALSSISSSAIFYVPDSAVDSWKADSSWSTYSGRIKSISSLATDAPDFYQKIQQYL